MKNLTILSQKLEPVKKESEELISELFLHGVKRRFIKRVDIARRTRFLIEDIKDDAAGIVGNKEPRRQG